MLKHVIVGLVITICGLAMAQAQDYQLDPITTQCYLFSHNQLQQNVNCQMTGKANTGKVWSKRQEFVLSTGQLSSDQQREPLIHTLLKTSQRKYLAKNDKILMPITPDGNKVDDIIDIAILNGKPAIRQNRLLKNYQLMTDDAFWGEDSELTSDKLTDRLACLQSEDNSFELCTPYADNDFRTD
jgi:hypothetical protein